MSNTSLLGSYGAQDNSALLFRNKIINGDMRIDQRNAGASVANANGYVLDRFTAGYYGGATGRFSAERSITAPAGFTNSFLLTTTTAQATLAANDGFAIRQGIEGFNVADFSFGSVNAQTITLSFWVRSSQTGVMGIVLTNGAGDRTYGATVTINSANTFEYKTVTIPGDTSGTWLTDSGIGLNVFFGLGAGSGRTIPVGWSGGIGGATPCAVTGQTINICASLGANIRITGVQLEAGPTATPFERRPIGVELQMCQRYTIVYGGNSTYEHIGSTGIAYSNTTQILYYAIPLPTQMRTSPVITYSGAWRLDDGVSNSPSVTSIAENNITNNPKIAVVTIGSSGLTSGRIYQLQANNSLTSRLIISAEL